VAESGDTFTQWDDVFVELFDKAEEIQTSMKTDSGDGVIVDIQRNDKVRNIFGPGILKL
jgi:hypothetical protein